MCGAVPARLVEVVATLAAARVVRHLLLIPRQLHGEIGQARRHAAERRDGPAAEPDDDVPFLMFAGEENGFRYEGGIVGGRRVLDAGRVKIAARMLEKSRVDRR